MKIVFQILFIFTIIFQVGMFTCLTVFSIWSLKQNMDKLCKMMDKKIDHWHNDTSGIKPLKIKVTASEAGQED